MRCGQATLAVVLAACSSSGLPQDEDSCALDFDLADDSGSPIDGAAGGDLPGEQDFAAPPDLAPSCNVSMPFMAPVALAALNTTTDEARPSLTADELTIYFDRGTGSSRSIFVAHRASALSQWGTPVAVSGVNLAGSDQADPAVAPDGLALFFVRSNASPYQLFMTTLDASGNPTTPSAVTAINALGSIVRPDVPGSGGEIWFNVVGATSAVYQSTWSGSSFSTPVVQTELGGDMAPVLTSDRLAIYFASSSSGIYRANRASTSAQFGTPTLVAQVNTQAAVPGWVSLDDCRLYFQGTSATGSDVDLWMAERP